MGWTLGRYFFIRYATITAWFFVGIFALVFLIDFTEFSSRTVRHCPASPSSSRSPFRPCAFR